MSRRSDAGRVRAARICLGGMAAVFLALLLSSWREPARILDSFWEQRAEERFLKVWRRQAFPATWAQCRLQPDLCPGKIVFWEVFHPGKGLSCFEGNCSQPIRWRNEAQVRVTPRGDLLRAVALVEEVRPEAIELVFLGSPDAHYGGTTRVQDGARAGPAVARRVAAAFDPHAPARLEADDAAQPGL